MKQAIPHTWLVLTLCMLLSACLGPVPELYPEDPAQRPVTVYLTSHGWHVGIVARSETLTDHLPDISTLPRTDFLEFGWGDAGYYTHPDPGLPELLTAGLLPTASVLHIAGFNREPQAQFTGSRVIRLQLSEAGMAAMADFIASYIQLDEHGNADSLGPGLYAESIFLAADGRYFFPFTSNWWTARALREAGLAITPVYAVTEANITRQALKSGQELGPDRD